jgi:hypothetical protein
MPDETANTGQVISLGTIEKKQITYWGKRCNRINRQHTGTKGAVE